MIFVLLGGFIYVLSQLDDLCKLLRVILWVALLTVVEGMYASDG